MRRRLAGFALLPLVGLLTPFLLLPIIARVGGPVAWTAIGVGQSVGVVGSVLTLWGWWIMGPARLSMAGDESDRHRLYAQSLQQRLIAWVATTPLLLGISALLTAGGDPTLAMLMTLATSAAGLSASWYSIGQGRPGQMVLFEDLPRAIALALAAVLVLTTRQVGAYPALLLAVSVAMPIAFGFRLSRDFYRRFEPLNAALASMRDQAAVATTNLVGTLYTATPVPIAAQVSPSLAVASFVSSEKIYRLGTFTIKALANGLQSWVLQRSGERRRRHLTALGLHIALGVVGGGLIASLAPWATGILFGPDLAARFDDSWAFGVAFAMLSASTPLTRNILVPAGKTRLTLIAGLVGAGVGVSTMLVLGAAVGASGVAIGLALSQSLIFLILIGPAIRWLRHL